MRRLLARRLLAFVLLAVSAAALGAQELRLPLKDNSVKFAVIGDTGTGDSHQISVANQLNTYRAKFPFDFVLMMGDNLYTGDSPKDYEKAFERPVQGRCSTRASSSTRRSAITTTRTSASTSRST